METPLDRHHMTVDPDDGCPACIIIWGVLFLVSAVGIYLGYIHN